jgi:pilus assembly protein FimV
MRFTTPHKRLQVAVCGLLFAFSPALHALGLGDAHVRSFLGQPLDVRIDLISHSQEELDAVTAGLANAADFRIVGLDRAALSVPLQFQVHADLADPHLRATSSLPVNDPVVQFVVAVSFPGGRMLREYMLFLDPPTFPAAVPMPALSPREAAVRPRPERPAATVAIEPETQPRVEPVPAEAPSASAPVPTAPARPEAGAGDVATAPGEPFQEPAVPEPQPAQPPRLIYREPAGGATYGPVARGETLWSIASEFATGTGYSVNQAMLAIQRQNPQAFINGNINALKRGAILRMPTLEAVGGLSKRAAMLEAIRQEQEYLARRAGRLAQRPAPAVAETPAARGGEPAVPGATDSAADVPTRWRRPGRATWMRTIRDAGAGPQPMRPWRGPRRSWPMPSRKTSISVPGSGSWKRS